MMAEIEMDTAAAERELKLIAERDALQSKAIVMWDSEHGKRLRAEVRAEKAERERDVLTARLLKAEGMAAAPERVGMIPVVHSLAPWRRDAGQHSDLIRDAFDDIVAILPPPSRCQSSIEQLANACLMTAAPQLLRIAETMLELHAAGSIRLSDELLQELLQLQQTARGGL
jgi:hypothetical protein